MADKIKSLSKILQAEQDVLDPEDLLRRIIGHFGGQDAFAAAMVAEFHAAKGGGMARQRIMELIARLFTYVHHAQPQGDPLDQIPTEDIQAALRGLMQPHAPEAPQLPAPGVRTAEPHDPGRPAGGQ